MVLLIHHTVSPASRKARLLLAEKRVLFMLREEEPWKPSNEVLKLNPSGELPIFVADGTVIAGNAAVSGYIEEAYPEPKFMPENLVARAEVRRIVEWFDAKFHREVYRNLVAEKVHKRFGQSLPPDSRILKVGMNNLNFHMEYIDWLAARNGWLAGEEITAADFAAAAQLSILDYLGDVPWENYRNAKVWYSKLKSRPSFKDVLKDAVKGILPSKHYANLDF